MKLKFKAEKKDITIFVIFAIALFYIVSVAVLNILSIASDGSFHGLNPFPVFQIQYLAPTMVFYLAALIAVFSSVSEKFFTREKGLGIEVGPKKSDGYSRWLTDKELKKQDHMIKVDPLAETIEDGGVPLMNNGKEIWVDSGEWHNLIIGSTASGKTESIVQPMVKTLAKAGESMIITDPKGEIYERNAEELKERGYNIVLLNFRNPQNGNCWNPITLPYSLYKEGNVDKATELLDDLAKNILYDEANKGQDPFWENTSADYFVGLCLALFEDAKEEEINLSTINVMTTVGEEKIGGTTYMKEYYADRDQASPAYINVASTIMAPQETKSSILSVFKSKIKIFSGTKNLSEMLSHSDFDMKDIGRQKTAVFIIIHDEKKTYHPLATIFVKQCYETLIDVAYQNGGKLQYKTNFILDEFANMPPLKDADAMVTAARSRLIRFTFIIQNFAQLTEVYGKEKGDTIKGNCGNWIYLISSELSALEEISKMCGEVKSKKDDKTASTPLITVSDLQRLPMYTMIILRTRSMPYKTKMTPAWKMDKENMWGRTYPKAGYPKREPQSVPVFDLKAFVDKKREEKINEMLGTVPGGAPTFPGMTANPFGGTGFPGGPSPANMPPFPGVHNGANIDEIVRQIDAKIAEMEAEEKLEKEKRATISPKPSTPEEPTVQAVEQPRVVEQPKVVEEIKEEPQEPLDLNSVTDDQFFDDFFNDDE